MNYRTQPYQREHIKAIRSIANFYGVVLIIRTNYKYPTADVLLDGLPEIIELKINNQTSVADLFSAFFHELGHVYCKHNMIYPLYNYWNRNYFNKKEVANLLRTCVRAEMHTDKVGKQLMKDHLPGIPFIASYTKANMKNGFAAELKKGILQTFKYNQEKKKNPSLSTCH